MKNKVSLIIPTKNEPYIGILVNELRKTFGNSMEIIVIEKGRILPKVKANVMRQKTSGLGNAFFEALQHAHGNIIANMDGDGSHSVDDLKKLLAAIKNKDLVIGSRFAKGGENNDVSQRRIVTAVARRADALLLGLDIKDMTSGFFVVRREVLEKIKNKNVLGYKMLFPIAFAAKKNDFRIKEVPIVFTPRKAGNSKVAFNSSGFKEVYYEIKMALLLRLGLF